MLVELDECGDTLAAALSGGYRITGIALAHAHGGRLALTVCQTGWQSVPNHDYPFARVADRVALSLVPAPAGDPYDAFYGIARRD